MLKILAYIGAGLLVAVAGVLVYAASKPDTFRVARSVTIQAPAERIFPLINDYRQWPSWSPYETKDPQMQRAYGEKTSGKGATYAWEGDSNVGAGNMSIADAVPPSKVLIRLNMVRPIEAHNDVAFTLEPQGDATRVTWGMQGPVPYLAKVMHVFIDVDKMVGSDFEAGLAKLKAVAER
jgi:uncharacterized protein YndB with AHSA1/START domain